MALVQHLTFGNSLCAGGGQLQSDLSPGVDAWSLGPQSPPGSTCPLLPTLVCNTALIRSAPTAPGAGSQMRQRPTLWGLALGEAGSGDGALRCAGTSGVWQGCAGMGRS